MKKLMLLKFMLILSFNSANAQFVEPPKGGGMVNEGGIAGNDGDILQGRDDIGPGMNGEDPSMDPQPQSQSNGSLYHEQCPLNVIDPFEIQKPLADFVNAEALRRRQEYDAQNQACNQFQNLTKGSSSNLTTKIEALKEKLKGNQASTEKQPDNPYTFNGVTITCGNYGGWFETLNTQFWKHFENAHDSNGKFAKDLVSPKFSWFDSQSGKGTNCLSNYESQYEADKDAALSGLTSCLQNKNDEMMFHVETSCEAKYAEYTEDNREERRQSTKDAYAEAAGDAISNAQNYIDLLFGMDATTQECPLWRATLQSVMNVAEDLSMISGNPLVSIGATLGKSIFSGIMKRVHERGAEEAEKIMNMIDDKKHYEVALCHAWEADKASCDLKDLIKLENRFGDSFKCKTQERKEISPIVDLLSGIDGMDNFIDENIFDQNGNRRTIANDDACFTPIGARPGDTGNLTAALKDAGDKTRALFGKTRKNGEESECSYEISLSSNPGKCSSHAFKEARRLKDLLTATSKNAEEVYGTGSTQLDIIEKFMIPKIESSDMYQELTRDYSDKKTSIFLKEFVQTVKDFDPNAGPRKGGQQAANLLKAMNAIQEELVWDWDSEEFKTFSDLMTELEPASFNAPERVLYHGTQGSNLVDIDNIKADSTCAHALVEKANKL
ncbi:MAG: hypothetical protein EP326_12200, partial [Deltaproteobacteria bacterium]